MDGANSTRDKLACELDSLAIELREICRQSAGMLLVGVSGQVKEVLQWYADGGVVEELEWEFPGGGQAQGGELVQLPEEQQLEGQVPEEQAQELFGGDGEVERLSALIRSCTYFALIRANSRILVLIR